VIRRGLHLWAEGHNISQERKAEKKMSILPEGEQLRRAVKWISEQRLENPGESLSTLIGEACLKFDLPPKDAEVLIRLLSE